MKPLIVSLILLLVPGMTWAQKASLSGKVVNGTTGQAIALERVSLMKPGQFGMESVGAIEHASRFDFEGLEPSAGIPLVLRGIHQGVSYSVNVPVTEAKAYKMDLTVYDTQATWNDIHLRVPHMIIVREGTHLQVEQTVEFHNKGKRTFTGDSLRIFVPESAHNTRLTTSYEDGLALPAFAALKGQEYGILFPLRPGQSRLQLSYEIDYDESATALTQAWKYEVDEMNVFVSPRDIVVASSTLKKIEDEELARNNFAVYQSTGMKSGETMAMTLSGGSVRARQDISDVLAEDNDVQQIIWIILPLTLALVSFGLYIGLSKSTVQRDRLVRQIAALDDSFARQGIPDDQYKQQRSALKKELREYL